MENKHYYHVCRKGKWVATYEDKSKAEELSKEIGGNVEHESEAKEKKKRKPWH